MKRALYTILAILALIRWAAAAHVTMTAGPAQVTMPVLGLLAVLAGCLAVAAAAFIGGLIWQEVRGG